MGFRGVRSGRIKHAVQTGVSDMIADAPRRRRLTVLPELLPLRGAVRDIDTEVFGRCLGSKINDPTGHV